MIELAADDLQVRVQARFQSVDKLIELEPMRLLSREAECVGVDRAIFLSWQMFGSLGR